MLTILIIHPKFQGLKYCLFRVLIYSNSEDKVS